MTDIKMNKIADKIQKLLSLAGNNPSAEEAKAALLKAHPGNPPPQGCHRGQS